MHTFLTSHYQVIKNMYFYIFTIYKYLNYKWILILSKNTHFYIFTLIIYFLACIISNLQVTRRGSNEQPFFDEKGNVAGEGQVRSHLYPPKDLEAQSSNVSVSGSGDCLAAAMIMGVLNGLPETKCVDMGLKAAALSMKAYETVPNSLKILRQ